MIGRLAIFVAVPAAGMGACINPNLPIWFVILVFAFCLAAMYFGFFARDPYEPTPEIRINRRAFTNTWEYDNDRL